MSDVSIRDFLLTRRWTDRIPASDPRCRHSRGPRTAPRGRGTCMSL